MISYDEEDWCDRYYRELIESEYGSVDTALRKMKDIYKRLRIPTREDREYGTKYIYCVLKSPNILEDYAREELVKEKPIRAEIYFALVRFS